ncbi:MAG: universal stress protein [Nitrospirae bacterium]|nr:universal stress protein [Nitrospirota bacterium]
MRIVLAVDASPDSRNAAQIITHLAEPPDLDVLNVVDVEALQHAFITPAMPADYYETYRKEVSELAERILHEMRAELTPYARQIRLIADTGDAAESIIQTAEESAAQLVIMGQRGMTATPTFLLGGVSQKVATYAPCSVLVVKHSGAVLDRILLAVDGSDEANKAVAFLARAPFRGPIRLTVVSAWPPQRSEPLVSPIPQHPTPTPVTKLVQARGEDLVRNVAAVFQGGPYEVETEWLQGDPAFSILESAGRHQAQMIVVGARGLKAIKRFFLGSVSQKVLVHAPCSVLIVR